MKMSFCRGAARCAPNTFIQEKELLKTELKGLVVKALSGFYTVETQEGLIVSHLPGRLKKERQNTDIVTVGDEVTISIERDGSGMIEAVAERRSSLSRTRPSARGRHLSSDREQVLVANLDQVLFVFSVKKPSPSLRMLDRFLVVAEMNRLTAVVCVNKVDLVGVEKAKQHFQVYEEIGYDLIYTSAKEVIGIDRLRQRLRDKITVFAGVSGVGKSSLLNAIEPGLGLKVQAVSKATGKGTHTTRYAEMFPLEGGGYVADTPGIRGLALFDVEPGELDAYFREMAPLVGDCQFSDCSHQHEPNCAIRAALETGEISYARYESYLRLREEHEMLDEALY